MDIELNLDVDFDSFDGFEAGGKDNEEYMESEVEAKKARRRTTECTELSKAFEYRRAYSEVSMLDAMRHVQLLEGRTYNFITAGDVDSLSYLKVVLNQHDLDYLLLTTWCMAAEDVLQIQEWYRGGRIRHLDMYLGEIFPKTYRIEWRMVKKFYEDNPEAGRAVVFRNHSKIYAGYNEAEKFYFGIQTSANINTNPRTEQGSITVSREIFDFYKGYFDGIKSIE
jgi:hypothetical protein